MTEKNEDKQPATVPTDLVRERDEYRKRAEIAETQLNAAAKNTEETKTLLTQLQEKVAMTESEKEKILSLAREEKKQAVVREIALKSNVVDVDAVAKLTTDLLAVTSEGKVVSASDPNVPAETLISGYLQQKPYLVSVARPRGAGTPPVAHATIPSGPSVTDPRTPEGQLAIVQSTLKSIFKSKV